ncbi:hypothetical protein [Streptomyces rubradiris]|uniref:Uncharacterized protein n=1 Tax=Streptomyces rubradiris TaxID=285531 RepID=A0ABQ3RQ58_STRRR|nr:hypothetical protein [Streptomyces rubradiris]GHH17464.1 hypothetical protein GCM10018792_48170 [Streptomyces rubradiris]GHI57989.1 hypothetical protein Srubr_78350 [Streptomyces rubradiris]
MRDSMSGRGPGEDRHRTERLSRAPGEEWTPEQDSPDTDEWSPGDATPAHRTPRRPRPEERLPGEPGRAEAPSGGTTGWISGAGEGTGTGTPGAEAGSTGSARDRTPDTEAGTTGSARGRTPDTEADGVGPVADRAPDASGIGPAGGRLPGSVGPGREGLTGDDRTPEDTPAPPPGPAGAGVGQWRGAEETGQWRGTEQAGHGRGTEQAGHGQGTERAGTSHGTEGLRPGTEELGDGFGASHRAERDAISEEHRMPDNGLGAPAPGEASRREAMTTDTPGRDTWPTAPGAPTRDAPRSDTAPATGPVGTEPVTPVTPVAAPATAQPAPSGHGSPLIAREEVEEWQRRMREVVGGFVDQPKGAVERADRTLEEIAARFSEAVTRRRRTLRMSWEGAEERGTGADTDTEQLRLALRDYRELAERLLHS